MVAPPKNADAEVQAWFDRLDHPLKEEMLLVRDVILRADRRVEDTIKWSVPTFTCGGNFASFNRSKKLVSLLVHEGASIQGRHPILEGDGEHVRTIRFDDLADVRAKAKELTNVTRAWCDAHSA